ncbi:MAG: winged helix DNA-binding protein [Pseudomonadota bacterium]
MMKIGILSWDAYKARNLAIARGELQPEPSGPEVWMPSIDAVAKILSEKNRVLLRTIQEKQPRSIAELATLVNRKQSNVSRTLKTMSRYGIAELREVGGHMKQPIALATEFQLELRHA